MQRIITATGKAYKVEWCGASTIDFALRFELSEVDMATAVLVFSDKNETKTLVYEFDDKPITYEGYKVFKGVDLKPNGTIVVALLRG